MKSKTISKCGQQGDVILRKLDAMPIGKQTVISRNHCVLAHGESGHSHVVDCEEAELIMIGERMILSLPKAAVVTHEEHKPETYAPGIWEIGRVVEYDYLSKMSRPVQD